MATGYIGIGAMGGALARQMLKTTTLIVFDHNPDAMMAIAGEGVVLAETARDLARRCDTILLCLPRSSNVEMVLFGPGGIADILSAGALIIDQTSGNPAETKRFANKLATRGVIMADAPVSGGTAGAQAGTIAIMLGCDGDHEARVRAVLGAISQNIFTCGDVGSGQTMKLINNTISACNRFVALEAVAMGRQSGLKLATMIDVLNAGGARSRTTETLLPSILEGATKADFAASLMLKDVNLATALAADHGTPLTFGHLARAMLQVVVNTYGASASVDEIVTFVAAQASIAFND